MIRASGSLRPAAVNLVRLLRTISAAASLLCASTLLAASSPADGVLFSRRSFARQGEPDNTGYTALSRAKRWKDVAEAALEAIGRNPTDTTALYWLGLSRLQLDDAPGALQALRSSQKLGLDTVDLHIQLGQVYYRLNQFLLFEQQMRIASQMNPQNGTPKYLLGFYRISIRSDVSGALADLSEAAKLQGDDPKVLYQLGYCLEMSGRSSAAKESYARAIDLLARSKQSFAWPSQGMARVLLNEDPQRALVFAQDAVAMTPDEPTNHLVLARVYDRLGSVPEAIREARAAADGSPTDAATRYLLFRLYRRAGDAIRAEQEMKMFNEINAIYGPE